MGKYLILIVFFSSCSSYNSFKSDESLKMMINLRSAESEEFFNENCFEVEVIVNIDLENYNGSSDFIFNIYDLSYTCNNDEGINYGIFKGLEKVSNLKYSHFLVENNLNEIKIFDEFIRGKNVELNEDCTYRNFNAINISNSSEDKEIKTSNIICKEDLLIRKNDQKIRFWYYSLNDKGKSTFIKSNWIELL